MVNDAERAQLRNEVEGMVQAVAGAVRDRFSNGITDLWLKGSAIKPWDTELDYVPELSDVDIHYRADPFTGAALADLDTALALNADIARRFTTAFPSALHLPRPQFVDAAALESSQDFVPPPAGSMRTVFGRPAKETLLVDAEAVRRADRTALLSSADPAVLSQAIVDLVERPGRHLYTGLRQLSWRISPLGPRVLSVLGLDYATAWCVNRTEVVRLLTSHGQDDLASLIASFYTAAWQGFRTSWCDGDACRAAFGAAVRALRLGASIAREA